MIGRNDFKYPGGTELMVSWFEEHVLSKSPELSEYNWIVAPGPEQVLSGDKNIAWVHLGVHEDDLSWLERPDIKAVVFVSHYQYQEYIARYNISHKSFVIKNAIVPITPVKRDDGLINLIFHPEPYRGLGILLQALKRIEDDSIRLHVFGDLSPQGGWKGLENSSYTKMASEDSRVILRGRTSNDEVREQLARTDIFMYPSTWKETSCIALIEALSAGCICITNNLTVLPETAIGLARIYEYRSDVAQTINQVESELRAYVSIAKSGLFNSDHQRAIANAEYSWATREIDWVRFLSEIEKL